MEFNDLIKSGRLKEESTSKAKIAEFLEFAENELAAAKFNLNEFLFTAYKSAYDSLIHAGNALIRHYGYRPTTKYTHVTITEFVERVLGKDYADLVRSFKHMRRKRHPMQYEAKFLESKEEVNQSIQKAGELIKKIEEHIKIYPPQKRLF